jgi:hypothetical protein
MGTIASFYVLGSLETTADTAVCRAAGFQSSRLRFLSIASFYVLGSLETTADTAECRAAGF